MKLLGAFALAGCVVLDAGRLLAQGASSLPTATGSPAVIEAVAPDFPDLAVQARLSAVVEVTLGILANGEPGSAVARMVSGSVGLAAAYERAAEAAALLWRFEATPGDVSPARAVTLTFRFQGKTNDGPIVAAQQRAQLQVVFKPPFEVVVIAAPYVCYTPRRRQK